MKEHKHQIKFYLEGKNHLDQIKRRITLTTSTNLSRDEIEKELSNTYSNLYIALTDEIHRYIRKNLDIKLLEVTA